IALGIEDGKVRLWDVTTGEDTITLLGSDLSVRSLAFDPDGMTLAAARNDTTIRLWNAATGESTHTLQGHADAVQCVAFCPRAGADEIILASGSSDTTLKLWYIDVSDDDDRTGSTTFQGHAAAVQCVAFSPDGKALASGSLDQTIKLWDRAGHTST